MHKRNFGFTLLELLVVIVIIGLLAGYVAPKYFSQVGKSETQVARAQIDSLEKALDQYRLENRRYPSAEEGLAAIAPYLRKAVPNDPWGRPYVYRAGQQPDAGRGNHAERVDFDHREVHACLLYTSPSPRD